MFPGKRSAIYFFAIALGLFFSTAADIFGAGCEEARDSSVEATWSELLLRMPYPHRMPLPPAESTPIDGTYAKRESKDEPRVPCRRCPDYAVEGGTWKLHLDKGVFRIFHEATGWKSIGSFVISGEEFSIANDPVCHEVVGRYTWNLENGRLVFRVIEDPCAIELRAKNLTSLPWLSCQAPDREPAMTGHWLKPARCDNE
jgi:hypothetical protein